jgi:hypothetical protein
VYTLSRNRRHAGVEWLLSRRSLDQVVRSTELLPRAAQGLVADYLANVMFYGSYTILVKRISFHFKKTLLRAQNVSQIFGISSSFTEIV